MADTISILVLGAGELGMAVLRGLARNSARSRGTTLTVLLRPSTICSPDPVKQRDSAELRSIGVEFQPGDLVEGSVADDSALFKEFHTVIGCTGFVAGRSIQLKLARRGSDSRREALLPLAIWGRLRRHRQRQQACRICSTSNWTCATSCDRKAKWNG